MITIRNHTERGIQQQGWLDSRHSFSFGSYYDPDHTGVSVLKVINDDSVKPGAGFAMHSHQDMEIISYVKRGKIEHKDSMGNIKQLSAGEFQLMSAGSGIKHSEYNPSCDEVVEFLQIWIEPDQYGITPRYQQNKFIPANGLQLIISPDVQDDVLHMHQDAYLYQLILEPEQRLNYDIATGRTLYMHLVCGEIIVNGERIVAGDGVTIKNMKNTQWSGLSHSEALLFDLP
ncbi:MAG: pirin family protein [Gammaproteobacteria bacterium]|nr:pirin family protein [Gammaproteobacteria bacterium]